jgi:hypothetical protein
MFPAGFLLRKSWLPIPAMTRDDGDSGDLFPDQCYQ